MDNNKKNLNLFILLILVVILIGLLIGGLWKAKKYDSNKATGTQTNAGKVDLYKLNKVDLTAIKPEQGGLVTRGTIIPLNDDKNKFSGEDRVIVDTVNVRDGVNSVKLTKKSSDKGSYSFERKIKLSLDSDSTIGFWIYKDSTSNLDKDGVISILLSCYNSNYNYFKVDINASDLMYGWNFVKYKYNDFKSRANADWKDIDGISIVLKTNNDQDASISISSIEINEKTKPTVILCVDGNYNECTTYLFPLIKSYGFKITNFLDSYSAIKEQYVQKKVNVKGADGKVTTQIQKVLETNYSIDTTAYKQYINDGTVEIATSGLNPNSADLIKKDNNYNDQYKVFNDNLNRLNNIGIGETVPAYNLPTGTYNMQNMKVLKDSGFNLIKQNNEGYINFFNSSSLAIPQVKILDNNIENVKKYIDHCIEYNTAICLTSNDILSSNNDRQVNVSSANYETILKYLKEKVNNKELQVVSAGQFINQSK